MWDNLIESLDKLNDKNPGQGCILAHCMGLGKTLSVSVICFLHYNVSSLSIWPSALESRSEGLGFDSHHWSCKLRILQCLSLPSHNGYLVQLHKSKGGSIVASCIGAHLARSKVKSVKHV